MDRPSIKDLMENITFEKLPAAVAAIYEKLEQIEDLIRSQQRTVEAKSVKPTEIPDEYITRKEVAKMLKISLPTLSDWTKDGILKGYRIATRVRYKRREIEQAIKATKVWK